MGCIIAGRTASVAACKASCDKAASPSSGCVFTVVSPSGSWHLPSDTTQNQTLQMCSNGPILSNGTQCSSCGSGNECEQGCEFGAAASTAAAAPVAWKALLRPQAASGGSYTILVTRRSGQAKKATEVTGDSNNTVNNVALHRVTFGDVSGGISHSLPAVHCFLEEGGGASRGRPKAVSAEGVGSAGKGTVSARVGSAAGTLPRPAAPL